MSKSKARRRLVELVRVIDPSSNCHDERGGLGYARSDLPTRRPLVRELAMQVCLSILFTRCLFIELSQELRTSDPIRLTPEEPFIDHHPIGEFLGLFARPRRLAGVIGGNFQVVLAGIV
jgi:hypothetical protein